MGEIKSLHNLDNYITTLRSDTIELIPTTKKVVVIKKLVSIHDIFDLACAIRQVHDDLDLAAIQELGSLRLNLQLFHRIDFEPVDPFDIYNGRILRFLRIAALEYPQLNVAKYITSVD
jgi:hypothetical protein